jgi:hypothetical protein
MRIKKGIFTIPHGKAEQVNGIGTFPYKGEKGLKSL